MNVVFILCDSLIRDYLEPYHRGGGSCGFVRTPNLQRLADRACTFTNHWIGSAPCMPARRELWSGRIEFPWRSWGPLEPWDANWAKQLTAAGVNTCLVTDHANLFEMGAGNYHWHFAGYEHIRGHVNDYWETNEPSGVSLDRLPRSAGHRTYVRNAAHRTPIDREDQSFAARTLSTAARWLDGNARSGRPFFLMVDEFDPHWPYDPPEPYASMCLDEAAASFGVSRDELMKHAALPLSPHAKASDDPALAALTRARYAGKLTMVDRWLGEVLDRMDALDLWRDTMLIVTTDHGEQCGEHDLIGKGHDWCYPEFSHIPLFVHVPGPRNDPHDGERCDALTTTVDLHATVLDAMGQAPAPASHGRSLLPLLRGECERVRDAVMFGWWGRGFYCTDGAILMCKAPTSGGPKYQYGTWLGEKWTGLRGQPFDRYAGAECGRFLPHVDVPVYRVPANGMAYANPNADFDAVFDLAADPTCEHNRWDDASRRKRAVDMLVAQMREHGVPQEHYVRLGLG